MRVRLIEIGEAVKDLDQTLLADEPGVPWTAVARMRDQLAHRYFDTSNAIVQATVDHDLGALESGVCGCRASSEEPLDRPRNGHAVVRAAGRLDGGGS